MKIYSQKLITADPATLLLPAFITPPIAFTKEPRPGTYKNICIDIAYEMIKRTIG